MGCLVHLLVASVLVFKGLSSSLHTIAARERAIVTLTFTDTRTPITCTRSRYLAVHVPNMMLFVHTVYVFRYIHPLQVIFCAPAVVYLSLHFISSLYTHRLSTEPSSGALIS